MPLSSSTPVGLAVERSGLRKDFIAERVGVRPWTLSRWIAGSQRPSESEQRTLAVLLHLDVAELEELIRETVEAYELGAVA